MKIRIFLITFIFVFGLSNVNASTELDARKELTAIGIEFNNQSLITAISKNDKLVVGLFAKSGHSLEETELIKNPYVSDIPYEALVYFDRTMGGDFNIANEYKKYQEQYFDAVKFVSDYSGLKATPLMLAVFLKKDEMASLLIKAGADVNKVVEYGSQHNKDAHSPLSLAIKSFNFEMVKLLLDSGASQNLLGISQAMMSANDAAMHGTSADRKTHYKVAHYLDKIRGKPNYAQTVKHYSDDANK